MFQQFWYTQITSSSFVVVMAQSSKPSMCFTSRIPKTSVIATSASNYIAVNKGILDVLSLSLLVSTVTIANGIMSHIKLTLFFSKMVLSLLVSIMVTAFIVVEVYILLKHDFVALLILKHFQNDINQLRLFIHYGYCFITIVIFFYMPKFLVKVLSIAKLTCF